MSKVHHLFFSDDNSRKTLHKGIIPTDNQQQLQQERWDDLAEFLKEDLQEVHGYAIGTWLQGSYKFGTQIRPARKGEEYDIDLGVYFEWAGNRDSEMISPLELKQAVNKSLNRYLKETEEEAIEILTPSKTRCERIKFKGGFHIDVPVYHLDTEIDERSLATEENEWEDSDPKAIYLWFKELFEEEKRPLLKRLIRYLKMWSALNCKEEERPSSILLTVLAAEQYGLMTEKELTDDDIALYAISKRVLERLRTNSTVLNPVDNSENLNRLNPTNFRSFFDKLEVMTETALRALQASSEFETAVTWQELFHNFFPIPSINTEANTGRQLIPVIFVPRVHAKAVADVNKAREFTGINEIGSIPKNCTITFSLINHQQLPPDAEVHWVVRNEGEDAENENDMGHMAGTGLQVSRGSAYVGTHFMDVIARSPVRGVLGFQRVPVTINGTYMPARNIKKPGMSRRKFRK